MGIESKAVLHARLRSKVQEWLAQPLHALFDELDTRLFDLAERSRSAAQQHLYFDALRQLRLARVDVETRFLQSADQALQAEVEEDAPEQPGSPLRLIEKDEQEETLHLESHIQRLSERLAPGLGALLSRLSALEGRPLHHDPQVSAISPRGLSRAFREAMQGADIGIEIRLIVLGLFGQHVLRALEPLYACLNAILAEAGILPELPETPEFTAQARGKAPAPIRRTPPRRVPDADAPTTPSPTPPPSGLEARPDGNQHHLDELHQLMRAYHQSLHTRSALAQDVEEEPGSRTRLPAGSLDAALARLWTYEGEPLEFKPQLLAAAREMAQDDNARLASEDEDIVDLIGLLFTRIRNDPDLPAPLQGMLARLHIPFLRTALKDPTLLHGASHPARELIDELGELAISWCASSDPNHALLKRIALTVEQLASHFQDEHPIAFAQAILDLRQQLETQRHRADLAEQRTIETAIGRERLALARNRVASLLQQRLRQHEPMPWVRQLLRGPWSNHLALVWLRNNESSQPFRQALEFVDELLWADDPRAARTDPARLARARQTLPDQLRTGLAGVSLHDSEIESLTLRLRSFLDAQAQGNEAPDFLYENDPTLSQSDFSSQWKDTLTEEQPAPAPLDPDLLARLRSLPPGTWFEFRTSPQQEMERAKLCWTSPYSGKSLFVNRNGLKVQEIAPESLAAEIEAGLARLIDSHRLLERNLRALIDQLRQYVPAARAS
ncbi:DUF1631 family protein [Xanthomonadaceae bacterium XH05]|nr:DUF1631 family protein [Xanthomonadaceae bacterium XH05]